MAVQLEHYRFTTAEYHRMAEAGALARDARVELIEGEVLQMSPIGRKHNSCVDRSAELLFEKLRRRAIVRIQGSIVLNDRSEPEPDLMLLRRRPDFYASSDATSEDVLLIIEVADSSLEYDLQVKAPLYARNGIPELWIAAVDRDYVAIHRDPTATGYSTTRVARRGEVISPLAFPDLTIPVDEILGTGRE